MYIDIHTYTYMYIYTYTYVYVYMKKYTYILIYTHIHICTYTHMHMYIYIWKNMYIYIHIQIYIYMYTYIYIYIFTYIYMYTTYMYVYMSIHIYICTYLLSKLPPNESLVVWQCRHIYIYIYIYMYIYIVQGLSAAGGEGPEIKVNSNNSDANPMAYVPHACIVVKQSLNGETRLHSLSPSPLFPEKSVPFTVPESWLTPRVSAPCVCDCMYAVFFLFAHVPQVPPVLTLRSSSRTIELWPSLLLFHLSRHKKIHYHFWYRTFTPDRLMSRFTTWRGP